MYFIFNSIPDQYSDQFKRVINWHYTNDYELVIVSKLLEYEPICSSEETYGDLIFQIIKHDPSNIKNFKHLSNQVIFRLLDHNLSIFHNIPQPTEDVQIYALKKDISLLRSIYRPSNRIQTFALQMNFKAIDYIAFPCREVRDHICNAVMSEENFATLINFFSRKKIISREFTEIFLCLYSSRDRFQRNKQMRKIYNRINPTREKQGRLPRRG